MAKKSNTARSGATGSTGVLARACRQRSFDATRETLLGEGNQQVEPELTTREGKARPGRESERLIVPRKLPKGGQREGA
jgi:hypothetical protein